MRLLPLFGVIFNIIILLLSLLCDTSFLRGLIITQIITNVYMYVKGNTNIFSCGLLFYLFICLFHYGIFIESNPTLFELGPKDIYKALRLSLACISAINIGYFLKQSKTSNIDIAHTTISLDESSIYKIRKLTWFIVAVTIIPMIYIDVLEYIYTYSIGYEGSYAVGQENKLFFMLSRFSRPAILVLLLAYSNDKKIATRILFIFCLYLFLKMFSGHRADSIIYITATLYIYMRFFVKKITSKHLILGGALFALFMIVLSLISYMRVNSIGLTIKALEYSSTAIQDESGFLTSFFTEFGSTLVSVAYPMKYLVGGFNYGLSYIYGFFFILPAIPEDIYEFIKSSLTFTYSLKGHEFLFLGGSCIGELYYNFSWFAPFFAIFIGWFIRLTDIKLSYIDKKSIYSFLLYLSILPTLFMWVRGYFCNILFVAFWIPVIYKFLLKKL